MNRYAEIYSWWFPHRLCFDEPEADPGAEHDESERGVDLEQEEAGLTLEEKVELHTGVISEAESVPPARDPDGLTVAFVCQVELSQGHLVSNSERLLLPPQTEFYTSRQKSIIDNCPLAINSLEVCQYFLLVHHVIGSVGEGSNLEFAGLTV